MRFAEELIARPSNNRPQAEKEQKTDEQSCHAAKDHVLLSNEIAVLFWLRLVQVRLHDSPHDGMQGRLDVDDAARPTMQEIEVLVGDARD
jgi:hypothetical protein